MGKINIEKQDSVKLYKIRKTLDELSKKSGRGTELITVYGLVQQVALLQHVHLLHQLRVVQRQRRRLALVVRHLRDTRGSAPTPRSGGRGRGHADTPVGRHSGSRRDTGQQ